MSLLKSVEKQVGQNQVCTSLFVGCSIVYLQILSQNFTRHECRAKQWAGATGPALERDDLLFALHLILGGKLWTSFLSAPGPAIS